MFKRHSLMACLLTAALLLTACARAASTPIPTDPLDGGLDVGGSSGPKSGDPTIEALSTAIALTQTAAAGGVPIVATPVPPTTDPNLLPTALPTAEVILPTPTFTLAPEGVSSGGATCASPYVVQTGDWALRIAQKCNISLDALQAANPGVNLTTISVGQQLAIPNGTVGQPPAATPVPTVAPSGTICSGEYVVRTGDNLFRLAYNCGLTTEQLAATNNIPWPFQIKVGQIIRFP